MGSMRAAVLEAGGKLMVDQVDIEDPRPGEVLVKVTDCGICHSDLHFVNNDWGNTVFPCVPGHEIVGRVSAVGDAVSGFVVGETVAVGPIVHNCGECESCREGLEQYCNGPQGRTEVYNGPNKLGGTNTYGGCANF